jgi:hypothetical protein
MYCTIIIIIKAKNTFTTDETLKINNVIKVHVFKHYLKKSNIDVYLAQAFLGCGDSVNWQFG